MKTVRGLALLPILLLVGLVILGGGTYIVLQNNRQPAPNFPVEEGDHLLLSEEQAFSIAQDVVVNDLGNRSITRDCLNFTADVQPDFITYTAVRKSACIPPDSDPPFIPAVRINMITGEALVRAVDGVFRPIKQPGGQEDQARQPSTANWKTYTNTEYGFQLEHPSDWTVNDQSYMFKSEKNAVVAVVGPPRELPKYQLTNVRFVIGIYFKNGRAVLKDQYLMRASKPGAQAVDIVKMNDLDLIDADGSDYAISTKILDSAKVLSSAIESQSLSVPGMSKYTDTEFGFSFWYPTGWSVKAETPLKASGSSLGNGVIKKVLNVGPSLYPRAGFTITEVVSPDMSITDVVTACPMGNCGDTKRFYFDKSVNTWMVQYPEGLHSERDGSRTRIGDSEPADVSNNTMGGLHIFRAGTKGDGSIIPLSAHNFLLVYPSAYGELGANQISAFVRTFVATDPSVATPVSAAEQIKIIEAEKAAYAGQ